MKYRSLALACTALTTLFPVATLQAQEQETVLLDEVVLTARRFEERLQDAPVAVTAVTAEDLAPGREETLEDALTRSPNLHFNPQGGPVSIRGITSLGISGGVDRQPAVGIFIDDVFLARPMGYPMLTWGLDRVEVVRGSQSLLYGKNTIGGAINLVMPTPDGSRTGEAFAAAGSNGTTRAGLKWQTPLGSDFAVGASVEWAGSDGYIRNRASGKTVGDTDALSARMVVAGTLDSGTKLRLSADYTKDGSDGGLWYAPLAMAFDHEADHDYAATGDIASGGLALRIDHDFGGVELTSITGWRKHDMDQWLDGDFSSTPMLDQGQTEHQRQISQEFRLGSTSEGPVSWRTGLFFMREDFEGTQFYDYSSVPHDMFSRNVFDQTADTVSAFGEATWRPTDQWEISAGARWTRESKETTSDITSPSGTFAFGAPGSATGKVSYTNVSPEVSVTRRLNDTNLVYSKLSRGFKSGGISPYIEADGSANRYDPETSTTLELGWRGEAADGAWTLAATAYWTDWQDQQAVIYTSPVTRVYRNAAEATSKGFEIEGTARLAPELHARFGYGYTNASYGSFVDTIMGKDYSGNPLPFAPRNSFNLGLDWQHDLANGNVLTAGLNYVWRDSYSFTPDNSFRQGAVGLFDARIGVEAERWSASLYAKNLTDKRYLRNYFDWGGTPYGVAAEGRTVGVLFATKF